MKFSLPIIGTALALVAPALGCIHAWGQVYHGLGSLVVDVQLTDNGVELCNSAWGWYWDGDRHISLKCIAGGYIYAFTQDGADAWFGRPGGDFSWYQSPFSTATACDPENGKWCTTNAFNTYMYC